MTMVPCVAPYAFTHTSVLRAATMAAITAATVAIIITMVKVMKK